MDWRMEVEEMDTTRLVKPTPELPTDRLRRYIQEHTHCVMCLGALEISHEINRQGEKIKEVAYCPQCGVRARTCDHSVQ